VLTDKVKENNLIVVDDLKFDEIKTKKFAEVMANLKVEKKALVVIGEKDDKVLLSARNIAAVKTALPGTINVYDIMNANKLVLTRDAVQKIEEVYA